MHKNTKKFMYRIRERIANLEADIDERLSEIMQAEAPKKVSVNSGPNWIDSDEISDDPIGSSKGSIIDFLAGKTKVKSYSQRGKRD